MVKRTGPTNFQLRQLIGELEKSEVKLWRRIAHDLKKSSRQRRMINVYKLEKCLRDGEIGVVPGKVLNSGELKKKVSVAAFSFSNSALEKIKKAGGEAMSIEKLFKDNPEGKKVRILG